MKSNDLVPYIWDQAETLSRDEMEILQIRRLQDCIQRVTQRVPFYREKLGLAGVTADTILSLGDMARIPFTTKQDLRDQYPFRLFAASMDEIIRVHASSGTTGKPIVVAYTQQDLGLWADLIARSLAMAGVTKNDIVQNAYGYGLFTGGLGIHYGTERLGATILPISVGNTARQIMLMQDFGSTVLCSTPSYALLIAEVAQEEGIDPKTLPIKLGIFGAEPWSELMREEIESRFGIVALDIYGLSEIIGPGVAMECAHKQGSHIFEDHFIPEVIDPDTGEPMPDGETGELVLSCVTKEALPLLRYRTRDRTRLIRDRCPCGRTTVRMDRVMGRTDDMLIVRGVNVFPSQVEAALLKGGEVEPYYEIIVDRGPDHTDEIEVLVEVSKERISNPDQLADLQRKLAHEVQTILGISCKLKIVGPKQIQRSEGKAVRVVDRRSL